MEKLYAFVVKEEVLEELAKVVGAASAAHKPPSFHAEHFLSLRIPAANAGKYLGSFPVFEVYEGRTSYTLMSASVSNYFEELSLDMEAACYGCYFCEIDQAQLLLQHLKETEEEKDSRTIKVEKDTTIGAAVAELGKEIKAPAGKEFNNWYTDKNLQTPYTKETLIYIIEYS